MRNWKLFCRITKAGILLVDPDEIGHSGVYPQLFFSYESADVMRLGIDTLHGDPAMVTYNSRITKVIGSSPVMWQLEFSPKQKKATS
jgi:hypothetical protein